VPHGLQGRIGQLNCGCRLAKSGRLVPKISKDVRGKRIISGIPCETQAGEIIALRKTVPARVVGHPTNLLSEFGERTLELSVDRCCRRLVAQQQRECLELSIGIRKVCGTALRVVKVPHGLDISLDLFNEEMIAGVAVSRIRQVRLRCAAQEVFTCRGGQSRGREGHECASIHQPSHEPILK
jgi:hypothetical protein